MPLKCKHPSVKYTEQTPLKHLKIFTSKIKICSSGGESPHPLLFTVGSKPSWVPLQIAATRRNDSASGPWQQQRVKASSPYVVVVTQLAPHPFPPTIHYLETNDPKAKLGLQFLRLVWSQGLKIPLKSLVHGWSQRICTGSLHGRYSTTHCQTIMVWWPWLFGMHPQRGHRGRAVGVLICASKEDTQVGSNSQNTLKSCLQITILHSDNFAYVAVLWEHFK